MNSSAPAIEVLEARVAPAAFVNPTTVTYIDPEGDAVLVKSSLPIFDAALTGFTFAASGAGEQLQSLVLGAGAAKTSLSFTAKMPLALGDGHVNVGRIDATAGGGIDLGKVSIDGDLGQIDAGDANMKTPGLRMLVVQSLGAEGLTTQGGVGDLMSTIMGALGGLTVRGDIRGAGVATLGGALAKIGPVTVGGSILGNGDDFSGSISSAADIGPVKIRGSIIGGAGDISGFIESSATLGKVSVGGSIAGGTGSGSGYIGSIGKVGTVMLAGDLIGGAGNNSGALNLGNASSITVLGSVLGGTGGVSGELSAASAGSIKIGGDVQGGSQQSTGRVLIGSAAGSVWVGGSVIGSNFDNTGGIYGGDIGSLTVAGDLIGGSILANQSVHNSGYLLGGVLGKVHIGGSVIAGSDLSTGTLQHSGAIHADKSIGTLTIDGNLMGNNTNPVLISSLGYAPAGKPAVALAKLSVGGSATIARILGGYDSTDTAVTAATQIGTVTIGGDWAVSDLVASVAAGADGQFGTADDAAIVSMGTARAHIAKVIVGGRILGTTGGTDHYGIEAQQIDSIKIGLGSAAPLTAGADDFPLSSATGGDVRVREFL